MAVPSWVKCTVPPFGTGETVALYVTACPISPSWDDDAIETLVAPGGEVCGGGATAAVTSPVTLIW
jgi:hypothetical protein